MNSHQRRIDKRFNIRVLTKWAKAMDEVIQRQLGYRIKDVDATFPTTLNWVADIEPKKFITTEAIIDQMYLMPEGTVIGMSTINPNEPE